MKNKMNIQLPQQVNYALTTLRRNGFEAYIVGGCVRDSIMQLIPNDWDITTNALPEETMACFAADKIIKTGLKHGTITLLYRRIPLEITTFRVDGNYSDNRRPDSVTYTSNLKDDLARRDFTINALAYAPELGIIDYYDGLCDIQKMLVKCVGDADARFGEDALRIIRALRFSAVLNFSIENETAKSIHRKKHLLKNIAAERITSEFNKLIIGDNAAYILTNYVDVLCEFMPEIQPTIGFDQRNPHHIYTVWDHIVKAISAAPQDLMIRLTLLLHDIGKPQCFSIDEQGIGHFYMHGKASHQIAENVLKRLKYPNSVIKNVLTLVLYHDADLQPRKKIVRRWLNRIGEDALRQLLIVKRADIRAQHPDYMNHLNSVDHFERLIDEVIAQNQCFSLRDLAVNGTDLLRLGLPQGNQISRTLNFLLEQVMDEKVPNTKEALLTAATMYSTTEQE